MNNMVTTAKGSQINTAVLSRLADRWRPVGLFLACLDKDGNLLWHDSQMPRIMSMCLTTDTTISLQIKRLAEMGNTVATRVQGQLPWVQLQLVPVARRRKISGWIALLGRTETVTAGNEEVARFAQRVAMDAQALVTQAQRVPLVPAAMFTALTKVAEQMHEDLQGAAVVSNELGNVTEQLTSVYEEISLLYKISSGMRFSQKPETFLETVCRELQAIGNFRSVLVSLQRREEEGPEPAFTQASVQVGQCVMEVGEILKAVKGPIKEALAAGETRVHNEIPGDCDWAHLRTAMQRFVCVPLERDHRPLGVMIAIDKNDGTEFNSVDMKLLNNVGNLCSMFLENAALYADMQDLFMGVLHALTRSIDAKDAYTRGHSQRVAELSRELARKMGLPEEQCERVYLSGLLHDVGKIGVPEQVLTKPGRLTDAEFDAIKKHPAIGAQILGNIKQLQDIIPGVLYHHERWDGRGYPYQLAGENIPLMGRIICVADSFDAMSSTRTYRPALPLETVLEEIKRCAGQQFDPTLAKLFVTLDFLPYRQAVEEQRFIAASSAPVPLLDIPGAAK